MMQVLQTSIAVSIGVLILVAYRDMHRRWPAVAALVGLGIALRAGVGSILFWVSYLDLPLLDQLHDGGGFWSLAPDARFYFDGAAAATERGLGSISSASASPTYVRLLALWMNLTGVSPASAILLNLGCYALTCALLLRLVGPQVRALSAIPIALSITALTLSPALVLVSTQVLKDVVIVTLVWLACIGWLFAARALAMNSAGRSFWAGVLGGFATVAGCALLIAGIRPYYALFIWCAAASSLAVIALVLFRRPRPGRRLAVAGGGLTVIWLAFMFGAGPYYEDYSPASLLNRSAVATPLQKPALGAAIERIDVARERFRRSGGNTNVKSVPDSRIAQGLVGLATMFVPISVLETLSVVDFDGGRGLHFVTDLDTIFFDLSLIASVAVLLAARSRGGSSQLALTWFAASLAVVTGLLMAYIVTNYGTMFRLRLMVAAPIWILPALVGTVNATGIAASGALPAGQVRQARFSAESILPPASGGRADSP